MRGLGVPTMIGIGPSAPFGWQGASSTVNQRPWNVVRSSCSRPRRIWMSSAKRSTRSLGGGSSKP